MKYIRNFLLILATATMILAVGCKTEEVPPTDGAEGIIINIEQVKTIGDSGLKIHFISVEEDSRCPKDAICFWEGQVLVKIGVSLSGLDLGSHIIGLSSRPEVQKSVTLEDYTIELLEVNPYPVSSEPYSIRVKVTD